MNNAREQTLPMVPTPQQPMGRSASFLRPSEVCVASDIKGIRQLTCKRLHHLKPKERGRVKHQALTTIRSSSCFVIPQSFGQTRKMIKQIITGCVLRPSGVEIDTHARKGSDHIALWLHLAERSLLGAVCTDWNTPDFNGKNQMQDFHVSTQAVGHREEHASRSRRERLDKSDPIPSAQTMEPSKRTKLNAGISEFARAAA